MTRSPKDRAAEAMAEALRGSAEVLDLHGLGLEALPPWPAGLRGLRALDLGGNRLATLPRELWQLSQLERLDLGSNRLLRLDPDIARLTRLRRLDLSENRLAELPAELAACVLVERLDLFDNRFEQWPSVLLELTALEHLDLACNQLGALPASLDRLGHLAQLDLSGNKLANIDSLTTLAALAELHVDDNRLRHIPAALRALPVLSVRGNPLAEETPAPRYALLKLVSGGHARRKRYFGPPLRHFNFVVDLTSPPALEHSLDLYYKGFAGEPVGLRLYDGTFLDLPRLGRRAALELAMPAGGGFLQFAPTRAARTVTAACEFAQRTLDGVPGSMLLTASDATAGHAGVIIGNAQIDGSERDATGAFERYHADDSFMDQAVADAEDFDFEPVITGSEPPGNSDTPTGHWPQPFPVADRSDSPAPPPDAEPVDAAVFCPPAVTRDSEFMVQVFLYPPETIAEVEADARLADDDARLRGTFSLPLDLPRGTRVDLHLEMPGLTIVEPDAVLIWRGRRTPAQFGVLVPPDIGGDKVVGSVRIAVAGMPKSTLRFQLALRAAGAARPAARPCKIDGRSYRHAFVSYCSKDRAEVLRRVQAFRIAGISVFQDILELEPGELWETGLYREIDNCDVFLLFWSQAAADSEWVAKEIDYALARKHGKKEHPPAIQPVPIEGPPIPPRPVKLSEFHFNDALLAHIAVASGGPAPPASPGT